MARTIGGVNFDLFRGRVARLKTRCDTWEAFGVDGVGVSSGGLGDGECQLQTVFYAEDSNEADSHIGYCEDLQGQIVNIDDARGRTFPGCLVERVITDNCELPVIWNGNSGAVRVTIGWMIRRVGV